MDRAGWTVWALAATLMGIAVAANAALMAHSMSEVFVEQSKAFPEDRPWFYRGAGIAIAASAVVSFIAVTIPAYGWGKVAAKRRPLPTEAKPLFEDEEDPLQAPPGFAAGPRVRIRRRGLAPWLGFNAMGLAVLAVGLGLVYIGVVQLVAAAGMDGRGFQTAVLWSRLLRFGGLPLMGMAGCSIGLAWGRWFPIGQKEVIPETAVGTESRPSRASWDRQA